MIGRKLFLAAMCCLTLVVTAKAQSSKIDDLLNAETAKLVETYKMLHAAPELSGKEEKTSAFVAKELRALGYEVTERIGKYDQPGVVGYGVVGLLKNGAGPTVLVRADMDALPVEEKTGLPYASKVKTKNDAGLEVSVMHACGHDTHIASFLTTAKMLALLKSQWKGTLMLVAQPAEETIGGAKAMVNDGLYTRFPKPDYLLGLHAWGSAAGTVGYVPGYFMASADSVDITVRGVGGHGSRPEATKDPVVVAAQIVLALQTIVSREISPLDPAVVTVGSIHGGTKHNIISDEVHLQLTVRSYKAEVRKNLLTAIERIAKGVALTAGIPERLAPIVKFSPSYAPATYNDPALTARMGAVLEKTLGKDKVTKADPVMGSEDFGFFGLDNHQIPGFYFFIGVFSPEQVAESQRTGVPLPSNHSSSFAPPNPEPTLTTGVKAMTSLVLDLMKK
ncbi:MAG: amidohydrolase [Acidobacteriota bacterium]|nr:amidohydrolase [Acidobacteriota bacterium]